LKNQANPVDWGVKEATQGKRSEIFDKFEKLLAFYAPATVVIEQSEASKRGVVAKSRNNEFADVAKKHGIAVHRYPRSAVQDVFAQFNARTKYEIAKTICTWLPALAPRMPPYRRPWMSEDYRMGIFDAFALALTHYYVTT
jgi:Holliday junction resolvasome RuvABC endonuclease subunit